MIDWYSSGVYYCTETITDLMLTTTNASSTALISFFLSNQLNESKRFWSYFYCFQLLFHGIDGFAHFVAVLLYKQSTIAIIMASLFSISNALFTNVFVSMDDLPNILEWLSNVSLMKFPVNMAYIAMYGFDRCPTNQTSKLLMRLNLTDDHKFVEHSAYIWAQVLLFRLMTFIAIILTKNPKIYRFLSNRIKFDVNEVKNSSNDIELQTFSGNTSQTECYENPIQIDLIEENSSVENQLNDENDTESQEIQIKRKLSIAWIHMTLKVKKTFYSEEKLILRGIKGFIEFGTLTALMGPSGAGKTSLLRCLNGMYRNLMTKESKIYLSNSTKMRTCFIAQDQREHINPGLTAEQSITYASKLKNIGRNVNHSLIVNQLMEELMINEMKGNNIEKCSSGQQKRIVMAMELTAEVKPNLICVDEPTSGVDSYSALLVCDQLIKILNIHQAH